MRQFGLFFRAKQACNVRLGTGIIKNLVEFANSAHQQLTALTTIFIVRTISRLPIRMADSFACVSPHP